MPESNKHYSSSPGNSEDDPALFDDSSKYDVEEDTIKQALLERPRFSIKARLTLLFIFLLVVSAAVSVAAMLMLSMIDYRVQYISLADRIANEIQHSRRIEKNYFLYGADLLAAKEHIASANRMLEQGSRDLGDVIGQQEFNKIGNDLRKYDQLMDQLIAGGADSAFKESDEYKSISQELRNYGSAILELSLDISKKERQEISSTLSMARRIHIVLLVILISLSILIVVSITRHIIKRLNRLMEATQQFAAGDFRPITPRRKYKDEFSMLAIAFNHMMYELEKRQHLLVESHKLRAIGNLTAGVAHELNNPLNNIIITAAMLQEDYKELPEEERLDMLNDLVTQGERARQVVKNLLDFARESETKTEYLYLDKLIEESLQLVKNQIKLSKVNLETDVGQNLPPIYGDRKLLIQVFLNLFINAVDAMPEGGRLSVEVKEEKKTGFLAVQVTDSGTGIPEHILTSIFNPFFTTKPVGGGTGLGLSVSKGIIEKHGGHIDVESKVGKGSTFIVYLPIVPIPADIRTKDIHASEPGPDN